jgi:hypothetical protein
MGTHNMLLMLSDMQTLGYINAISINMYDFGVRKEVKPQRKRECVARILPSPRKIDIHE